MSEEQPARILVVDDNPATLYSTARILRSAHFEVIEAATGQEALDLRIHRHRPADARCKPARYSRFRSLPAAAQRSAHGPPSNRPHLRNFC